MTECATCGGELWTGDAHHFDAAGNLWHEGCDAPEVLECSVDGVEVCEACD